MNAIESSGRDIELIDLRTINPFDMDTVAESVQRTGRPSSCTSTHDLRTRGRNRRRIMEECFLHLETPCKGRRIRLHHALTSSNSTTCPMQPALSRPSPKSPPTKSKFLHGHQATGRPPHFILPDLGEGVHEASSSDGVSRRVKPSRNTRLVKWKRTRRWGSPSPWTGVIKELHGSEGEIVNVGNRLVTYDIGGGAAPAAPAPAEVVEVTAEDSEDAGTVVGSVDATLSVPASFARRSEEAPVETSEGKALATPAVRRIAKELRIDINVVQGTGRGGRVTASDVQAHAGGGTVAPAPVQAAPPVAAPAAPAARTPVLTEEIAPAPTPNMPLATPVALPLGAERIPFKASAGRSLGAAPFRADHRAFHGRRRSGRHRTGEEAGRARALIGRRLSLLPRTDRGGQSPAWYPILNANVDDFVEEIHLKSHVHLGCAVDTEHGLMVPVIKDADTLSVVQLADSVATLAAGCRNRSIDREQLTGGTFTISNVGSAGGAFATPIINYPEVAILAAGRSRERVLTRDGVFYAGSVLPLSLSCDHRVVDGAEGARFLNTVTRLLQDPTTLLPQL